MSLDFLKFPSLKGAVFKLKTDLAYAADNSAAVQECCQDENGMRFVPPATLMMDLSQISFFDALNPGEDFDTEPQNTHLAVGKPMGEESRLLFRRFPALNTLDLWPILLWIVRPKEQPKSILVWLKGETPFTIKMALEAVALPLLKGYTTRTAGIQVLTATSTTDVFCNELDSETNKDTHLTKVSFL